MFLLFLVVVGRGVMAESTTCDASYSDNCNACAFYNFGCGIVTDAVNRIPTCFKGIAQSPINLDSSFATIADDPGQLTFSGYNKNVSWPGPPVLRVKDFTVQLDFNQPMQRKRKRGRMKKLRKTRQWKNKSLKLSSRDDLSLPSISGGALGDNR